MPSAEKISAILGARIDGVDLSQPVDPEAFRFIEDALHEFGFVVLPGQTLSSHEFVAFSRLWGRPEPHVIDRFHHPDDPNILILSNVHRDGQPIGLVDAGTYFVIVDAWQASVEGAFTLTVAAQ